MNIVQRMEIWGDTHHPKWLDIIRVALGIFLCYKGVQFLNNMGDMLNLMTLKSSFGSFTLVMPTRFINSGDVLRPFSELALSIIVLLLLLLFLVVGNGYWSFKWFADRDK